MTSPTTPTWCTAGDVGNFVPGVTASDADIQAAQFVIDLVSNRTYASSGIMRSRDIEWLRRAVAYQCAWMLQNPDLFSRSMVKGISQDGVNAAFQNKHDIYLAPLAARALKNCRWLRSRSLRSRVPIIDDILSPEDEDFYLEWSDF